MKDHVWLPRWVRAVSQWDNERTSDLFEVASRVKQSPSIPIRYRYVGNLFNLCHLQDVTKVQDIVIRDILFADDLMIVHLMLPKNLQKSTKQWP